MQTLNANNADGKGPYSERDNKPTEEDPDPHNPPLRAPGPKDSRKIDVHGASVTHEDSAAIEAAEGEIRSTPQGP